MLGAYCWLSDNYKCGDCIFLFGVLEQCLTCMSVDAEGFKGFSCGAFEVRILFSMIDKVSDILRAFAAPFDVLGKFRSA